MRKVTIATSQARRMGAQWLSAALLQLVGTAAAVPNGLGQTPAMAWSSWNYFAFNINETIALEIGDALISTGLAELGYEYVNIDAGSFTGDRDNITGKILWDAKKYPHGMRWLSDQLHAKGWAPEFGGRIVFFRPRKRMSSCFRLYVFCI